MNLLFDLDGTLTDPLLGIGRCIQHAMSRLGREAPPLTELSRYIGPPLRGTFAELLASTNDALIATAIALYRERFANVGMFENEVYPGVAGVLEQLTLDGHGLWIVTSKPRIYARDIIAHFQLATSFRGIYGSELDGRNTDKTDLVRLVLRDEGLAPDHTWMVGDRSQDVRGGRLNGTRTAGALWGYGSLEELSAEAPDLILTSLTELPDHLRAGPAGA